jgi:hypothetical protein
MRYVLFFTILLFGAQVEAQKLVKRKLADNISVRLPKNFEPMTDEDKAQRYESARLPIALYTDPDRLADFGVNRSYSTWQQGDLEMMEEFYQASILELYDKVNFISMGIKTVNEHDFVYFEFESYVYPQDKFQRNISKYSYLMYALEGGTTYLFNFTCEHNVSKQWQGIAHQVMASVKLK